MNEHRLQLEIIAWFRNEFERTKKGIIIPIVNEATYKNNTFIICKGASDLIIVLKGNTYFCELKVGSNKQSLNQIEFENNINNLDHEYKLIRTLNEFKEWLKDK